MKLFLIGFASTRPEQVDVARSLQKEHDIQYWVRMRTLFAIDEKEFPGTIFHDYHEAIAGVPAPGIDAAHFEPSSAELITTLSSYESEFLTMMNKWYPDWNVSKRKDFWYDLLRYWSGVLDICAPEVVIFLEIPHEVYSFVLFALCNHRGIRTLMFENVLHYGRLVVYDDYRVGNRHIEQQAREGFPIRADVSDLHEDIRIHYETERAKDETPSYVKTFTDSYRGYAYWMRQIHALGPFLQDGSIYRRVAARVTKLFSMNLPKEYHALQRKPDLAKPYVYAALHFQPERTTCPQGGVYADQILMVRTLSAALPKDWMLYVKEHPTQWSLSHADYVPYRYKGYYKAIAAMKNVVLVPVETDSFTLVRRAKAVATVTGTVGWEAVLRNVPALVFGYAWYKWSPGVFQVDGVETARAALLRIADGYKIDQEKVVDYLACMDAETFVCRLTGDPTPVGVPFGDDAHIMHEALVRALGARQPV